jgi:hypothetical protein
MLTGQELYLWERAGYFIRRDILAHQENLLIDRLDIINLKIALKLLSIPIILDAMIDLHPEMRLLKVSLYDQATNRNSKDSHVSCVVLFDGGYLSEISGEPESLLLRIALMADDCLHVIPGTHSSPVHADNHHAESLQEDKTEVPVRLQPGDFICYHANLDHHDERSEISLQKTLEYSFLPLFGDQLNISVPTPPEAPRSLYRFFGGVNDG